MAERPRDAFEAAVGALRRRERTSAELASWLEKRGFGDAEVEGTISSLIEAGELDDERFACRYAEDKRELRGWGAERIREALASKGLAPALVERVLAQDGHDAQLERAAALLARRGRPLVAEGERARALGFLTRRGYDYEVAYEAVLRCFQRPSVARRHE